MNLSNLKYAEGSRKNRKKVGRGGAHGKQSGRGHNGAKSRSGNKLRPWFEGGQMPIQRRLPKRGFKNFCRQDFQIVNVAELEKIDAEEISLQTLVEKGIIKNTTIPVKILGDGTLTKKISVSANAFSKKAKEKIEAAGGRITIL